MREQFDRLFRCLAFLLCARSELDSVLEVREGGVRAAYRNGIEEAVVSIRAPCELLDLVGLLTLIK
jgi:hypothetical protein